ncbi:MAG: pyruvate formate lyase family protein [Paludibacteraceae bacterium]
MYQKRKRLLQWWSTLQTTYIQCTGLGTVTDSLSALKKHVSDDKTVPMEQMIEAVSTNFQKYEVLRQRILNNTPFFGNDDDYADEIALRYMTIYLI